jgi:hypothetical protein
VAYFKVTSYHLSGQAEKIMRNMIYDEFHGLVSKLSPHEYEAGMKKNKPRHTLMSIFTENCVRMEPDLLDFKGKILFLQENYKKNFGAVIPSFRFKYLRNPFESWHRDGLS